MAEHDGQGWLEPVKAISEQAGERIMAVYRSAELGVEAKDDDTPLTRADRAAHDAIKAGLQELDPAIPQLSEEGEAVDAQARAGWQRYWLIDPLDGTREFIKGNGEFTVNVALVADGVPVLGVVHAPDLGVTWGAVAGGGAWREAGGA
ncbi:MAG: 3'(2'),5'-bisphosphate nucleotidase CysQ, partial [Halorhodospira sp.]